MEWYEKADDLLAIMRAMAAWLEGDEPKDAFPNANEVPSLLRDAANEIERLRTYAMRIEI